MSAETSATVRLILQGALATGCLILILWAYRDVRRQRPRLAAVVALGVILRAGTGALLFWVSYLDLPFLSQLQEGDGFWQLAPDARGYVEAAAAAAEHGLATISGSGASPAYVRVLALWMKLVGPSPASALLLNVGLYALTCVLLLRLVKGRTESWATVAIDASVVSLTLSPALVLVSTQALKDAFFVTVTTTLGVGWLMVARSVVRVERRTSWAPLLAGVSLMIVSTYLVAGIRPYYALFIWGATASTLALLPLTHPPTRSARYAVTAVATVAAIWTAFMIGAGPYYELYSPSRVLGFRPRHAVSVTLARIDSAREGFIRSGGTSNLATLSDDTADAESGPGEPERHVDPFAKRVGVGLAAMFVPVSILDALSIVRFSGRPSLLFITDVDTLFFGLSVLVSLGILLAAWGRRQASFPVVWFTLSLTLVTLLTMAYVVTNFGTMFRLRLMVATPLWILPALLAADGLAVEQSRGEEGTGTILRRFRGRTSASADGAEDGSLSRTLSAQRTSSDGSR